MSTIECPVCGAAIPLKSFEDEIWGAMVTTEKYAKCPSGHYSYSWAHGQTEETIGGCRIGSNYLETETERAKREGDREAATEEAKGAAVWALQFRSTRRLIVNPG